MVETVQKHDFIQLSYTGRLADGTVFDTTDKAVALKNNLPTDGIIFTAQVICIGERQVLPGLEEDLLGKEVGKSYQITLPPEKAFGKRDIKRLKVIPMSEFKEHQVPPRPGLQVEVDGERGIITSLSGGRIVVNFNHPLAGQEVSYEFKILRKVDDTQEKVKSFISYMLHLPEDKLTVAVTANSCEVALPAQIPAVITSLLTKKLIEVTGLKEFTFKKTEAKNHSLTIENSEK